MEPLLQQHCIPRRLGLREGAEGIMETVGRTGRARDVATPFSLLALEVSLFSLLDFRCLSLSLSLGPGFLSLPLYL